MASPSSGACFVLTNVCDESTRLRFANLRARVEAGLHHSVCVVGLPVRRTLKLLNALARGTWVVGEEYLEVTARSRGAALDPSPYELTQHIPGCRVAREAGGGCALTGLEVTLRGATGMPRADLAELLRTAGASVREGRDVGPPLEVHREHDRSKIDDADETWLLDRIMTCDRAEATAPPVEADAHQTVTFRTTRPQPRHVRRRAGSENAPPSAGAQSEPRPKRQRSSPP